MYEYINLTSLNNGIYLIKVYTDKNIYSEELSLKDKMIDINSSDIPIEKNLHQIVEKVINHKRLTEQEGLKLFINGSPALLGSL